MDGVSLFTSYKTLWETVHTFDHTLTPNTLAIEHALSVLRTFPFDKVTEIMTDHVRKLTARFLGLMYLPYNTKQNNAIQHLLYHYPTTETDKELITTVQTRSQRLRDFVDAEFKVKDKYPLRKQATAFVTELTDVLYDIPAKHLWIVVDELRHHLTLAKEFLGDDNSILTALDYLFKYKESLRDKDFESFEQQLVNDITILLAHKGHHPQIVMALENALNVLSLYYTPVTASKLFIQDVEYQMRRYIAFAEQALGSRLMTWFRNETWKQIDTTSEEEVIDTEMEVNTLYQTFLSTLNQYQQFGTHRKELFEYATKLKSLPYNMVSGLRGFATNMIIVDNIQASLLTR